jgi:hypothetical protein
LSDPIGKFHKNYIPILNQIKIPADASMPEGSARRNPAQGRTFVPMASLNKLAHGQTKPWVGGVPRFKSLHARLSGDRLLDTINSATQYNDMPPPNAQLCPPPGTTICRH